ncbi:MAG: 16S rRNA (uracil(1498)-N(3))-methyltransferase [Clostridiales bacterium]|nr:16S rRNA (uracil(1498)-N(3))-methyltransferase [Clostridiales bacterium]
MLSLNEADSNHAILSLRIKPDETITLSNETTLALAVVLSVTRLLSCKVIDLLPSTEPSLQITLYQGLLKGDKMEYAIQKGTEAGILHFVPVMMQRSIAKLSTKDEEKKLQRWRKIALEAAKQAKRTVRPTISSPIDVFSLSKKIAYHDLFLVPWEQEETFSLTRIYQQFPRAVNIGILIGPEGGITPEEIFVLQREGAIPITLGKRIFRSETAGLATAISLFTLHHDME